MGIPAADPTCGVGVALDLQVIRELAVADGASLEESRSASRRTRVLPSIAVELWASWTHRSSQIARD